VRPGDFLAQASTPETQQQNQQELERGEALKSPSLLTNLAQDASRGGDFQAHKTAFFFKLERELEKVRIGSISHWISLEWC
jgi:hypothetical protein